MTTSKLPQDPLTAHLLSPRELQRELDDLAQQPKLEQFALAVRLPGTVVNAFENPRIPQRGALQVYATKADRPCALLQIQSGFVLVELLIALGTSKARSWLEEGLRLESFVVVLDIEETRRLVVVQARVARHHGAGGLVDAVEKARTRWSTHSWQEFGELLADVEQLQHVIALRPRESLIPGISIEQSLMAAAHEMPMYFGQRKPDLSLIHI